jgi:outer membrane protein assembly factor BamB
MRAESTQTLPVAPAEPARPRLSASLRLWPAVALVAVFWALQVVVGRLELPYFYRFLYGMAAPALLVLLFNVWWWTRRRIRLAERLYGFLLVVGGLAVTPLCHPSIGLFGLLMTGLPVVLTAWTLWMLLAKTASLPGERLGSVVVVLLAWAAFALVRIDGLDADLRADLRWRWSPSAEGMFLAEKANATADGTPAAPVAAWAPTLTADDWPGFRGPNRDGVIRGTAVATDWGTNPPRLVWRHRVGPAWSSVIVVGDRLFTQEQRGEQEAVVCYDAATGKQLWVHEDPARFSEAVSGVGPRATPTFDGGRIYALGATGLLNCLDAATGKRYWSHDLTADAGAKVPMWGFSSSPLVVNGVVVVFGDAEGRDSLLAYRADTGEPAWSVPPGAASYSSPQLATLAGRPQVLMLSDQGLTAVDPATGAVLWKHGAAMPGAPRTAQPHAVGETQLLVATLTGPGVALVDVARSGDTWEVTPRWETTDLKPEFPDLVVHQGHAYGFDLSVFCCLDLATGKRRWKGGRYGRGQVMLLPDQSLLLVLSEKGEAVLLAADPERHRELGRFQAVEGKTWNHPVICRGRLYVRNAEEMACYDVSGK